METRLIPHTHIEVSTVCLGTMMFGNPVAEDDAVRIVHWALDNGINFLDTADIYEGYDRFLGSPGGVSETILGKALKGRRDRAVVTTKVGNQVGGGKYEGTGLGRDHIVHQLDSSLRRLQTDYVDFYELHRPDPETPLHESVSVMADLISQGKVRHWGFSNFDAPHVREMVAICDEHGWPRPVISQPPLSWLERENEVEHMPACREYGIATTPYRPLEGGLLTGKYRRGQAVPAGSRAADNPSWGFKPDDELYDRLEQFEREAAAQGLRPAQYAVKWIADQPGVASVVVGSTRIEQLRETVSPFEG